MLKKNLTVFIVGLGQIGGSLGYDLMASANVARVIGYDKSRSACIYARRKKVIGAIARSIPDGIASADITILATPIRETIKLLPRICKYTTEDKIIIDVAGIKIPILNYLRTHGSDLKYISCHPIAGTERFGASSARKGLFQKTRFIMVPQDSSDKRSLNTVSRLLRSIGATPIRMDAKTHDRLIALTSTLPYIIALGMSEIVSRQSRKSPDMRHLTGGSLRSATRVAQSAPDLTFDMINSNRENVIEGINLLIAQLRSLHETISGNNNSDLKKVIARAGRVSRKLHSS